jgi:hypothetical protein
MPSLESKIATLLRNVDHYAEGASGLHLRSYQQCVATAIVKSVTTNQGLSFVVIFPRQSGKNELQAQIEGYLLTLLMRTPAEIVKVSPTWKPQSLNAMRRLERVLERNLLNKQAAPWKKEQGYIFRVGTARIYFFSGQTSANIVGATASTLLQVDEAQDVLISKFDKEISPMAASSNATRVFWGTAWTSTTLLAREKRAALEAQTQDGIQRVFLIDADDVAAEVPAYKSFVAGEIQKLGRNHPFIKTQYFSQEIDAEGSMFPAERQALMRGDHPPQLQPDSGSLYAFLIDVAGEDEGATMDIAEDRIELMNKSRDSTTLTIVEVDLEPLEDELINAPRYLVRQRKEWTGLKHSNLYGKIKALAEIWQPRYLVIDATGVGAGLASFFEKAYPERVIPFTFNTATKSQLGWDFLSIVETGRFKDHAHTESDATQAAFWQQLAHLQMEINPGPNRTMKWSVPDGTRDPATGEIIHDDLVISAALCALLDQEAWGFAASAIIHVDPLADLGDVF